MSKLVYVATFALAAITLASSVHAQGLNNLNTRSGVAIDEQKVSSTQEKQPVLLAQNETASEVHNLDSYMQQAGLPTSAELGEERWFNVCEIQAQQGAGTFNSGRTETCTYQHTIPGWQMLEYKIEVLENKYNRGSYKGDIIAADGNFTVNEQEVGDRWKIAIDKAAKAGDIEMKGKLELEYQRHQQLIRNYATNKNTFFLSATANGGLARKSVIRLRAQALMIRIQ